MNCHEIQEVMRQSVDGGLDSSVRKEVALHLASCEECMTLINDDEFWDNAVIDLLHREAPADLRADILGDLADNPGMAGVGWRKKLKLIFWAGTRGKLSWAFWVQMVAFVAFIYWLLPVIMHK